MFKRIRVGFEKIAGEMHKQGMASADKLLTELCERFREIGVDGTIHMSENMWESMGGGLIGNVAGHVKIEGQNIDRVQVEIEQHHHTGDEHADYAPYTIFYYHYVVLANVEGLEKKLQVNIKPIKKGFLSKEVVDFRWEGGDLAQWLNGDSELRNMIFKERLNQLSHLEVRAHVKPRRVPGIGKPPKAFFDAQAAFKQCVRITKRPRSYRVPQRSIGVGIGGFRIGMQEPTRVGVELPTRETFDIYDRIAQHVRNIIDSRS